MAIRFIDLCSGIGGFHSGLMATGHFECVGHAEIDPNAVKAYKAIYGAEGGKNYGDLRKINPQDLPAFDLLCAGFPCQSFSVAGRRLGFQDTRGTVFFEIARIIAEKRPSFLLLENVPGLLSHDGGRTLTTIFSSLVEMGYLPNIEGVDTQFITDAIKATGTNSQAVSTWQTALNKLANTGVIEKIGTSSSNVDRNKLAPGDIVIFGDSENSHKHVAIYSGTYKGVDFIIHVGNDRGPEISRIDWMGQAGDKSSYPNAYFHLPDDIFENDGSIEVNKKDTDGNALAGAYFTATNTETNEKFVIGPTDSKGYAKSEDRIPFGTYTITETVFPTNYRAYGETSWTRTIDANTPNATVTVNAVNELIPGSAKIVKTSDDGVIAGISFTVKGNGVDTTVTTDEKGEVKIDNLKPGSYTVSEIVADKYEPQEVRTVTVVSGQTATVTFNNVLKRGSLQVTKSSEDGLVAGVQFKLSGTSLAGLPVEQYAITDSNGIATFEDILITGHAPYVLEEVNTAERYVIPENQTAVIEWNKVSEKHFYNELKRGNLRITKSSEDGLVEGMKFHLYHCNPRRCGGKLLPGRKRCRTEGSSEQSKTHNSVHSRQS